MIRVSVILSSGLILGACSHGGIDPPGLESSAKTSVVRIQSKSAAGDTNAGNTFDCVQPCSFSVNVASNGNTREVMCCRKERLNLLLMPKRPKGANVILKRTRLYDLQQCFPLRA
jgi:hypothetical protein